MTLAARTQAANARQTEPTPLWPRDADLLVAAFLGIGLVVLFGGTFNDLARTIWSTDEQGQGPAILAISLWLAWRKRHELVALPSVSSPGAGWGLFGFGLALQWVGRTQDVLMFSTLSLMPLLGGLLLVFRGKAGLKLMVFPLCFLIFMVPLPGPLVSALTAPLKEAVSYIAANILAAMNYPVARSGVVLMVGQYQMLVADACAGLTSMFTLEAMGLLYMNLQNHGSMSRNVVLATLLVPVAFAANVIRVMMLVLVTYHFGDAAGQGFVHAFAGVLLFSVAIVLMMLLDSFLGLLFWRKSGAKA